MLFDIDIAARLRMILMIAPRRRQHAPGRGVCPSFGRDRRPGAVSIKRGLTEYLTGLRQRVEKGDIRQAVGLLASKCQ
jgi:hypothetical protein